MFYKSLIIFLEVFIYHVLGKNIFLHDKKIKLDDFTEDAALNNGQIIQDCLMDLNYGDNLVLLYNETVYYQPFYQYIDNVINISFTIDGNIYLSNNTELWPMDYKNHFIHAFSFRNSSNVSIKGNGVINGQGYIWWKKFKDNLITRHRPTIIYFSVSSSILIEGITIIDSPRFNIYVENSMNFICRYVNIDSKLYQSFDIIPTIPFNTDGIDFSGINAHIYNITVNNYDDVVAIKPSNIDSKSIDGNIIDCTRNVLVENISVKMGVGLSIGSISENKYNCIKDIIFQNITCVYPLKIIYIKTGSHDNTENFKGIVKNITYRNIISENSLGWPIYIGPQQQKEPDGTGDGFWPPTNPNVNISDIFLKNIKIKQIYVKHSGILRCNLSNPCTNINFENVVIDHQKKYYCDDFSTVNGTFDKNCKPFLKNCGLINT